MKNKLVIVAAIWLVIGGFLAVGYRYIVKPMVAQREVQQAAEEQKAEEAKQEDFLAQTSSDSRYDYNINFGVDSFSGYSVLRSDIFKRELSRERINLNLVDDQADYVQRLQNLKDGKLQMAAFTIDALVIASAKMKELPAVIVSLIDETRGADAMVAYESAVPNLDALNNPDLSFVLTENSPSETLARVVMSQFSLSNINEDDFKGVPDAESVWRQFRTADPNEPQVFVLWEPFVSRVLENPNCHVLIDSSRFRGYIVDVVVVNREFLAQNEDAITDLLGAYFRANHDYASDGARKALVMDDAAKLGSPLNAKHADRLVDGIWWKNTPENYIQMGVVSDDGLQHIEDMILNITRVLQSTGAIDNDPTGGQANRLYYNKALAALRDEGFQPGMSPERVRDDRIVLPSLSDNQWAELRPVGKLQVRPLVFARGTSRLTGGSKATLNSLVEQLETFPQYYVMVRGNASRKGNIDANKKLAKQRADAAEKYLIEQGVHANRIRAIAGELSGQTNVTFVFGQSF